MIMKNELSWLTRHFKDYPTPLVLFSASSPWSGYYDWNMGEIITIDGREYFNEFGAIVLAEVSGSNLANEYRHHLQTWRHGIWAVPSNMENNDGLLEEYYKSCEWEHDAMMFERSLDKDPGRSDHWFSLLNIPRSRTRALMLP